MSYTKEMCLFLLENKHLIENESLTEYVEKTVFKAINTAISKRLGERTPWRTRFAHFRCCLVRMEHGNIYQRQSATLPSSRLLW